MTVLSNGDVRPCCYTPVVVGNLYQQSLEEIWNGEVYKKMRQAFSQGQLPDVCKLDNCSCSLYYKYLENLNHD